MYDERLIADISRNSGAESIKRGYAYYRKIRHDAPEKFWYEIYEDKGYYVAVRAKNHIRWIGIAVRKEYQGRGIGKKLFFSLVKRAKEAGLSKITFRTSIYENSQDFYAKYGCNVVGLNGNDFEMEYLIK